MPASRPPSARRVSDRAPLARSAETIAVGSELLVGGRTDHNSVFLADELGKIGIEPRFKTVVGDEAGDIADAVRVASRRASVVIMTGGLGPTVDDCTREAVAQATGRGLRRRAEAVRSMVERLAQWGRTPSKGQLRQALIPSGSTVLLNPVGSAPGFCLSWRRTLIVALPGVPAEMERMFLQSVVPLLKDKGHGSEPIVRRVFHTFGLSEADVDERLKGLCPRDGAVALGLLASPLGVLVSVTSRPRSTAALDGVPVVDSVVREIRRRLAEWIYAEGRDQMEDIVGRLLTSQKRTVALAESCTGGLIGHRLTQVPGSSAYLDRSVVCYSNAAKTDLLGVDPGLIRRYGAVSALVAEAMARGVRERSGTDLGLSVTGIAGPGGATEAKPVGLVYVALDAAHGGGAAREFRFHGDRQAVKLRASQAALDLLRRWLVAATERAG